MPCEEKIGARVRVPSRALARSRPRRTGRGVRQRACRLRRVKTGGLPEPVPDGCVDLRWRALVQVGDHLRRVTRANELGDEFGTNAPDDGFTELTQGVHHHLTVVIHRMNANRDAGVADVFDGLPEGSGLGARMPCPLRTTTRDRAGSRLNSSCTLRTSSLSAASGFARAMGCAPNTSRSRATAGRILMRGTPVFRYSARSRASTNSPQVTRSAPLDSERMTGS